MTQDDARSMAQKWLLPLLDHPLVSKSDALREADRLTAILLSVSSSAEAGAREAICRDIGRVPFNNPFKLPSFGRIPWGNDPAVFVFGFREGVAWAGWRVSQVGEGRALSKSGAGKEKP